MNGKFVIVGIIIVFVGLTISLAIMQQIEIQKQNESSNIVNTEQIKSAKEIPLEKETTRIKSQQNELSSIRNSEQIIPKKKMVEVKSKQTCKGKTICDTELVTKIVDGDTLYTKSYKIRLSLTNTPEKGDYGFSEATQFTANLCPLGSSITIDQDDLQPYDRYGRLVGKVFCGEKTLNSELLYNNHANILTSYCNTSEFSNESWAKEFGCR
ncbi:MAG: thermonuclease family protein [Nitrosopumilus sp.]|jgi:endonuclease YncB( thermonuclease family)|nr:thermonuclease family protein [Nitrosopumilus sp.]